MNENEEIIRLQNIKYKLKDKEKEISDSQIKQNKLYNKLKKLKQKKEKISNRRKSLLYTIGSYIVYDIILITILISFISFFLDKIILIDISQKTLYLIALYLGVIVISSSAALISSKIDKEILKHVNKTSLVKIEQKIIEKQNDISIEIKKQEILKQELTNIINSLDNITPCSLEIENENITLDYIGKETKPLTRIKRK